MRKGTTSQLAEKPAQDQRRERPRLYSLLKNSLYELCNQGLTLVRPISSINSTLGFSSRFAHAAEMPILRQTVQPCRRNCFEMNAALAAEGWSRTPPVAICKRVHPGNNR
jgi:hypothetical protein